MNANLTAQQALPLLTGSLLLTMIAIILTVWGSIKSLQSTKNSTNSRTKYFQFNALLSNLFNSVSCICVSIYFLWLTLIPFNDFFLAHESIRLRIATTASWYTSKIFLFLIFNGRLFYAFRNSKYRSNHLLFKSLNIFIILHA
eukprot:819869_1